MTGGTIRVQIRKRLYYLFLVVAFVGNAADAADWRFEPRVELGGVYDDNYGLSSVSADELEVYGPLADLQLALIRRSPLDDLSLVPRFNATYFPDAKESDYENYFLDARWAHRGERLRSDLRGSYAHQTVFESEFTGTDIEGDLGDPGTGDTGRVTVRDSMDLVEVRERLTYRMTERWTIDGVVGYRAADYDETESGDRVDYESFQGSAGVGWVVSPTSTVSVQVAAGRFEPDPGEISESYGAAVEWRKDLSESQRMYVRGGIANTDTERGAGLSSTSDTSFAGGVGADWTYEVTHVFVDLTATLEPSGIGNVVHRDQLRLSVARELSPRWSLLAGARVIREESLGDEPGIDDREYAAGSLGLEWRVSRQFAIKANYELQWQEYQDEPSDAVSNHVQLSVIYEPYRTE